MLKSCLMRSVIRPQSSSSSALQRLAVSISFPMSIGVSLMICMNLTTLWQLLIVDLLIRSRTAECLLIVLTCSRQVSRGSLKWSLIHEKIFNENSFIFPQLFNKRVEIITSYNEFLQTASISQLEKLFGTKKSDVIEKYRQDIFKSALLKAIQRYEGVAYDYLSYNNLEKSSQKYIDDNVLIFSNLFGVLKASDEIPDYKLKQGESFYDLKIDKFYNDNFSQELDKYLENDDILDLRAGFYEKFYVIKKTYQTVRFRKDGNVGSPCA